MFKIKLSQYYCEQCWASIHSRPGREFHKPLVKEGADRLVFPSIVFVFVLVLVFVFVFVFVFCSKTLYFQAKSSSLQMVLEASHKNHLSLVDGLLHQLTDTRQLGANAISEEVTTVCK